MLSGIKFQNLTLESKLLKITSPIFTPATKNPDDETEEQIMNTHEKFLALSEPIKNKLASKEISEKIQQLGGFFKLELLQLADISRAIRSYYFGELKLEDLPFVLAKEMNVELGKARDISDIVIKKIINDNSSEEAYAATLENLTIPAALKKYPEIGEQLITGNRIKIKSFPDLARPSLKNWLADYTFNLGQGTHSAMARGNYLFQMENTKSLSTFDRNRLNYILKSLDENSSISVSKTTKQLIFPKNDAPEMTNNNSAPSTRPEEKTNIQSVQFSYPQKMVYEKKPQTFTNIPPKSPANTLGPNVVNLKE